MTFAARSAASLIIPASNDVSGARDDVPGEIPVISESVMMKTGAAALACSLCMLLAWPSPSLWPLVFLVPVPLVWIASRLPGSWRVFIVLFAVQWCGWLVLQHWTSRVTGLGYPFLAAYLALYPCLFVVLLRLLLAADCLRPCPRVFLIPVLWVAVDSLRSDIIFGGYGVFQLAHPLVDLPMAVQSADLLGTSLLTFLVALPAGAWLDHAAFSRSTHGGRRWWPIGLVAGAWALNLAYGAARLADTPGTRPLRVLCVQTNISQDIKEGWTIDAMLEDYDTFESQTRDGLAAVRGDGFVPDCILWPETMLPGTGLEGNGDMQYLAGDGTPVPVDYFARRIRSLVDEIGVPMLVGSNVREGMRLAPPDPEDPAAPRPVTWKHAYNSAYLLEPGGTVSRGDKRFLTPFGEVIPYLSRWPGLHDAVVGLGAEGMQFNLEPGHEPARLSLEHANRATVLAVPICFEVTLAGACRSLVFENGMRRADVLVNLTNDGWFGDSTSERRRHAQVARFRCIETRTPMIRCANTGLSMCIDSRGNIISVIGDGRYGEDRRAGILAARVDLATTVPLFARAGMILPRTCMILVAGALLYAMLRGRCEGSMDLSREDSP